MECHTKHTKHLVLPLDSLQSPRDNCNTLYPRSIDCLGTERDPQAQIPSRIVYLTFSEMQEVLSCPICKDYFSSSLSLPCSHTFCSLCIRRSLSSKMECPGCRCTVGGLHELRNDRGISYHFHEKVLDQVVQVYLASLKEPRVHSPVQSPPIQSKRQSSRQKKRVLSHAESSGEESVTLIKDDSESDFEPDLRQERDDIPSRSASAKKSSALEKKKENWNMDRILELQPQGTSCDPYLTSQATIKYHAPCVHKQSWLNYSINTWIQVARKRLQQDQLPFLVPVPTDNDQKRLRLGKVLRRVQQQPLTTFIPSIFKISNPRTNGEPRLRCLIQCTMTLNCVNSWVQSNFKRTVIALH